MWKFEKVFSDDGSELSTAAQTTTLGTVINAAYDGRFVWVTASNGVGIYEFWGESSDEFQFNEVEDLIWARYTELGPKRKLKLVTFISCNSSQMKRSTRLKQLSIVPTWNTGAGTGTVGSTSYAFTQKRDDLLICTETSAHTQGVFSPYWITQVDSKMCISSGANFSKVYIFDIQTQRLESVISTLPEPNGQTCIANSNLHGQNGRLWYVNTFYDDNTPQRLISTNIYTLDGTSTNINVRPGSSRTWIANGFNGFVYITNHNGVSVSRYNQDTGILGARIRTSALPHHIFTTQDRKILVASGDALLTTVDYDDDGVHHDHNTENVPTSMAIDPIDTSRMWFTRVSGNKLMRISMTDGSMLEVGAEDKDWVINDSGITAPVQVLAFKSRTYTDSNAVTKTTRPCIFVLSGSSVYLLYLDSGLRRSYYAELNGQGAVVGGSLFYFGEQG